MTVLASSIDDILTHGLHDHLLWMNGHCSCRVQVSPLTGKLTEL